ncbi:MAG: hypothetical protein IKD96_05110 [Oscillospiraceae bacterium]|nr:hypothetical protein [Oscillospiraceae bacterium]
MTNKEKYQRAFSVLHASDDCVKEINDMKKTKRVYIPKLAAVCAIVVLVLGLASITYAADIGGIQRNIQIWFRGDQTDAVLEVQDGSYTLTYEDEDGNIREQSGGGVAYDMFGRERALTEEEIIEHLDSPEVEFREDGSVWVYYHSQTLEITDQFDEDGVCYVQLKDGDEVLYMTVTEDSYSMSSHGYLAP